MLDSGKTGEELPLCFFDSTVSELKLFYLNELPAVQGEFHWAVHAPAH